MSFVTGTSKIVVEDGETVWRHVEFGVTYGAARIVAMRNQRGVMASTFILTSIWVAFVLDFWLSCLIFGFGSEGLKVGKISMLFLPRSCSKQELPELCSACNTSGNCE